MPLLENRGEDRARWTALVDALPVDLRDLHYTPAYFDIYERTYGHAAALFVFEDGPATLIQPFLRRPLRDFPVLQAPNLEDIESVYGYGGPLLVSGAPSPALAAAYDTSFRAEAARRGFVSEFCLLHPFLTDHQKALLPAGLELAFRKDIPYVDLRDPLDVLWSQIEERQRKAVGVARRRGVVIRRENPTAAVFADFQTMYLKTMERVGAGAQWRFPDNYFPNCVAALGAEGASLFSATVDGKLAAGFFLLHAHGTAYYHFSASDPAFNSLNATSLLLFDTLLWAKSAGYLRYHMGGGRTDAPDDSLLRFKVSFAKRTAPLYVYRRALLPDAFERLVRRREADDGPSTSAFFPPYRRP